MFGTNILVYEYTQYIKLNGIFLHGRTYRVRPIAFLEANILFRNFFKQIGCGFAQIDV